MHRSQSLPSCFLQEKKKRWMESTKSFGNPKWRNAKYCIHIFERMQEGCKVQGRSLVIVSLFTHSLPYQKVEAFFGSPFNTYNTKKNKRNVMDEHNVMKCVWVILFSFWNRRRIQKDGDWIVYLYIKSTHLLKTTNVTCFIF